MIDKLTITRSPIDGYFWVVFNAGEANERRVTAPMTERECEIFVMGAELGIYHAQFVARQK